MKTLKKYFVITCLEATNFVSRREEKKLSSGEQFKLSLHLAICGFCRLFEKQNKFIISHMKHIHSDVLFSAAEKEQLQRKIEEYSSSK